MGGTTAGLVSSACFGSRPSAAPDAVSTPVPSVVVGRVSNADRTWSAPVVGA